MRKGIVTIYEIQATYQACEMYFPIENCFTEAVDTNPGEEYIVTKLCIWWQEIPRLLDSRVREPQMRSPELEYWSQTSFNKKNLIINPFNKPEIVQLGLGLELMGRDSNPRARTQTHGPGLEPTGQDSNPRAGTRTQPKPRLGFEATVFWMRSHPWSQDLSSGSLSLLAERIQWETKCKKCNF